MNQESIIRGVVAMSRLLRLARCALFAGLVGASGVVGAQTEIAPPKGYRFLPGLHKFASENCTAIVPNGGRVSGDQIFDAEGNLVETTNGCTEPLLNTDGTPFFASCSPNVPPAYWDGRILQGIMTQNSGNSGFNKLDVNVTVPPEPARSHYINPPTDTATDILALWSAIEIHETDESDCNYVLYQPLLNYGEISSGTNGGALPDAGLAWWITPYVISVYPDGGWYSYESPLIFVNVGDTISQRVEMSAYGQFLIRSYDSTTDYGYAFYWDYPTDFYYYQADTGVLEAYNLAACDELPRSGTQVGFNTYDLCYMQGNPAIYWSQPSGCNTEFYESPQQNWSSEIDLQYLGFNCGFSVSLSPDRGVDTGGYTTLSWSY